EVLQSSIGIDDTDTCPVIPQQNGLVHTCLDAYNRHHRLVLRPDDIWIAIVTQFSFYVNKHAEEMRSFFVAHEGKQSLTIIERDQKRINFAKLTARMADFVQECVLDKELQEWMVPNFSTTTEVDTLVCSAAMLGAMKHYFDYRFKLACGIPSVTLLGDVSDWRSILDRLSKLTSFGPQHPHLAQWKALLTPVVQNMIDCFNGGPTEYVAVDFWSKIAHYTGGGSGPTYVSGWITAFCVFSAEGEWQGG
ncbi:hypothetical protein ACRALDRAFT_1021798, partial [Sodiomyces alcalophilus JCM 7366]|uniref:uncharacterized protein n=1 Tax=Sodiomyces alcalophilus JCM 7366 TaxID=591952 RepID=UPI0039B59E9D